MSLQLRPILGRAARASGCLLNAGRPLATSIHGVSPSQRFPPLGYPPRASPVASNSTIQKPLPRHDLKKTQRFREFDLDGKVFVVTGGGRGLGLAMAEALVEAGGQVHCIDRTNDPDPDFLEAQKRANPEFGGSLHYHRMDVRDREAVESTMQEIARKKNRLDGLIAAAGINRVGDAMECTEKDIDDLMTINYHGVFFTATAAAKQMRETKSDGSIMLVASISGLVANKGMTSAIYNSSKASVIQLTRNLAMEWGKDKTGCGNVRVNCLCPGHISTPMVEKVLQETPESENIWEEANMLGRLARPEEFRGVALFLLSPASSYMTGAALVMDGGHTAW
ncbi:hypothetical protein N7450_006221 [Penicillium hetheringtonii]|uniref:Uncharacterized protein n=1 Tax=Penicillium hetheringtonii TaxID=911720 RepID=A0AAD6GSP3_9EURO|nr:hypothetical protein N7450_006221 [Penicillium hetheringtonii]